MSSDANALQDHQMYRVDGPATADGGGGHDAETIDVTSEPPPPDQDGHVAEAVDAAAPLMSMTSNQLTLLYQGEVYVFDSVTPEKVQAVLLLLGGCEVPSSISSTTLPDTQDEKGYDDILRRANIPAKRIASLIRFREKRKERNFDKKIRYNVRKEVALRMQRRKGQFAGKASPQEGAAASSSCDPVQNATLEDPPKESKCQNCGISEKMTPAMRRGPAGPRSLCNACGLIVSMSDIFSALLCHSNTLPCITRPSCEGGEGTLRSPFKAKSVVPSLANSSDHDEVIVSELGSDNKSIEHAPNNHEAVATSQIAKEGMQTDVQLTEIERQA
ncbi:gata transcription factor [Musa troglodytarum]|uniref:Gata transcription factor n=1 Tax=Musa troglodytarum TaxID=320322 RepID=A0A9E7GFL9_9LILI|nr:gata transcription factor [Musa troglodytarum]